MTTSLSPLPDRAADCPSVERSFLSPAAGLLSYPTKYPEFSGRGWSQAHHRRRAAPCRSSPAHRRGVRNMNVLVIDIGGTWIKVLATGESDPRQIPSGPSLTPRRMVEGVKSVASGWRYELVSIGYPGPV